MTTTIFRVTGSYRGDRNTRVTFTMNAINRNQIQAFINAFLPDFFVGSVMPSIKKEECHYSFDFVNPTIAAYQHITNRRQFGTAIHGLARTRRALQRNHA